MYRMLGLARMLGWRRAGGALLRVALYPLEGKGNLRSSEPTSLGDSPGHWATDSLSLPLSVEKRAEWERRNGRSRDRLLTLPTPVVERFPMTPLGGEGRPRHSYMAANRNACETSAKKRTPYVPSFVGSVSPG